MLNVGEDTLETMERLYPGIRETVKYEDTAKVSAGSIGRSIHVASATTKMHLRPSGHPADYFCNKCRQYFEV